MCVCAVGIAAAAAYLKHLNMLRIGHQPSKNLANTGLETALTHQRNMIELNWMFLRTEITKLC